MEIVLVSARVGVGGSVGVAKEIGVKLGGSETVTVGIGVGCPLGKLQARKAITSIINAA